MNITRYELLFFKNLHKDIDIKTLSREIHVTMSFIYDVKSGRRTLSCNLFEKILEYYNVNYSYDYDLFDDAYQLLINMFKLYVSYDYDKINILYETYLKKKNIYNNSKAFVLCGLIEAIHYINKRKYFEAKESLHNCEDFFEVYDCNIAFIYLIIWMLFKKLYEDIEEIKSIAYPMLKKYSLINVDYSIQAMLYYQIGRINEFEGRILEAIKCYDKSIGLYQEECIYQRVIQVKTKIGNCYFLLKQYVDAENIYLKMYAESKKLKYKLMEIVCLNSLSFLYLVQEKYDEANKYINISKQNGEKSSDLNYYQACIAFKMYDKTRAKKVINNLISSEDNSKVLHILKFLRSVLNENDKEVIRYLSLVKKDLNKINKMFDLNIIVRIAIEYFRKNNKDIEYQLLVEWFENNLW